MGRASRSKPWWGEGLRFACTQCGRCCTGDPGYVWVDSKEVRRLAARIGRDPDDFGRRYLRRIGERLSLIEKTNGDCVFYEAGTGCTVYPDRPRQCRTYPFWPDVVLSPESWQREGESCPGIDQGSVQNPLEVAPELKGSR